MVSETKFIEVTNTVIDKLEGGYYHPEMLKDGRVRDTRYSASGETMFGLDRRAGAGLAKHKGWAEFWSKIDSIGAKDKWTWNYNGGQYAPELKNLAGKVMYQEYVDLSKRYLSVESQKLVDSDNRLVFNFAYATWNGSGWFKRFAGVMNKAVAQGERNKDKLVDLLVAQRTQSSNSLIAQGGRKIAEFIEELKALAVTTSKNPIALITIAVVAIGLSVFLYKRLKNK